MGRRTDTGTSKHTKPQHQRISDRDYVMLKKMGKYFHDKSKQTWLSHRYILTQRERERERERPRRVDSGNVCVAAEFHCNPRGYFGRRRRWSSRKRIKMKPEEKQPARATATATGSAGPQSERTQNEEPQERGGRAASATSPYKEKVTRGEEGGRAAAIFDVISEIREP